MSTGSRPAGGVPWRALHHALAAAGLAVVGWFALYHVDWAAIGDALAGASPGWIAAAFLVNTASLAIRGSGWAVAARAAVGRAPDLPSSVRAFLVGQAVNTVMPGRVGELVKVVIAQRHTDGSAVTGSALFGSVLAHRLMDVVPLTLVAGWVLVAGDLPRSLSVSVLVTVAVSLTIIGVAVVLAETGHLTLHDRRLLRMVGGLQRGFVVMRRPRAFLVAAALETVGWSVQIGVVWLGFAAFGLDAGPVNAATVVIATNAATMLPLWPGNLGLFQVAVAVALTPAGIPQSTGLAYGLALQGIEAVSAMVAGAAAALAEGIRPGEVRRMAHAAAPEPTPPPAPPR